MKVNFSNNEQVENKELKENVNPDSKLKEMIVEYVGEVTNPEDDSITTEMVIEVFAKEFPEFLMAVAEENFIRGYEQGINDTQTFSSEDVDEPACDNPFIAQRPGSE